jgi:alkanesulfonate monooxygenase SsuD/methylene tetrahydromethanopterin reductase-like flavin-dependent oxidoreductase (luciferase family)
MSPSLRIGVTLPTFTANAALAPRAAVAAESGGLDGVFAFDHLWPMGSPGRPAMWSFTVLAAAAARTQRLCVGPLVARVGLLPDADLLGAFGALAAIAGRTRVIAAVGTGDSLSAAENRAYGVAYPPAPERIADLERVAGELVRAGFTTWVGGLSARAAEAASAAGAGRNLWGVTEAEVAGAATARDGRVLPVTWSGQVLVGRDRVEFDQLHTRFGDRPGLIAGTVDEVAARLRSIRDAGASWCVCTPLDYLIRPEEAVETICLVRQAVP